MERDHDFRPLAILAGSARELGLESQPLLVVSILRLLAIPGTMM